MNITVYLGANEGSDPALKQAVEELGRWIGESGNALVYGGSRSGLMGRLAHSVLMAGGEVTGVEPQFFIDSEVQYDGLTRLIVTQDMTERKTRMIELGDAFIAFRRYRYAGRDRRGDVQGLAGPSGRALHPLRPRWLLRRAESSAGPHGRDGAVQPRAAERHLFCKESGRDKEHPETGIRKALEAV